MVAIPSRHKSLFLLIGVVVLQILFLAIQIRRDSQGRLIRVWTVGAVTLSLLPVIIKSRIGGGIDVEVAINLIFAVGSGDAKRAALLMDRLLAEQTSPVAILRAAQRHFLRLQLARSTMDAGASAAEAVKKLQPPVFWKFAESMAAQLRRWNAPKIEAALMRLYEAEAAVKRTGTPDEALCAQLLLRMAA